MVFWKQCLSPLAVAVLILSGACVPSQPPAPESEAVLEEAVAEEAVAEEAVAEETVAEEAVVEEAVAEEAVAEEAVAKEAVEDAPVDPYMPTVIATNKANGEQGLRLPMSAEDQRDAYRIDIISVPPEEGGGVDLEGDFDLRATIRRDGDQWLFKGTLAFPTGGFTLGEIGHDDYVTGPEHALFMVFIPVALPPEDMIVTQALDKRSLEYRFDAPENATFVVTYIQHN